MSFWCRDGRALQRTRRPGDPENPTPEQPGLEAETRIRARKAGRVSLARAHRVFYRRPEEDAAAEEDHCGTGCGRLRTFAHAKFSCATNLNRDE
jgi:hypothetical protein